MINLRLEHQLGMGIDEFPAVVSEFLVLVVLRKLQRFENVFHVESLLLKFDSRGKEGR